MSSKPNTPKGTRDFSSDQIVKRNYILKILLDSFKSFNYSEIQTPSFETLTTLTGKYGDYEDNLMFKIISSGEKIKKADIDALNKEELNKFSNSISDKALRYDLTVPLARYVSQNFNNLNFPFKRYQAQLVWRAERPQKGRYREFLQCDADIIGESSYLQVVESILLCDMIFDKLSFKNLKLRINDRRILEDLAKKIGVENFNDFAIIIDKIDKIGLEEVIGQLKENGLKEDSINILKDFFSLTDSPQRKIEKIKNSIDSNSFDELSNIISSLSKTKLKVLEIDFDLSLARGLSYYTGIILEVSSPESFSIGSIAGGGRYDNLIQVGNNNNLSGFGLSFGFDRIYLILEELNLFPDTINNDKTFLFINFENDISEEILNSITNLRYEGIICELYPKNVKIKKQLDYANKKNFDFVVLIGKDEIKNKSFVLKNMISGDQMSYKIDTIEEEIKKLI
ncbi:MAG TPA: histidine--tRNA ligase [Flavobacteriaceae bacterium]|jgi:histidyl-tRNA synthetase|nr:histidine--tRNA ligase [Flavobacteriaceae bacterium]HJO71223.1 histidine--tRNA ligase [Flavobacteriaceae bacterium]|tara:strand:- start:46868 stop:48229 length:1362 start_codon:yes stop_codon:yes gene_type:complete